MSEDSSFLVSSLRDLVSDEAWAGLIDYPVRHRPAGETLLWQGTEGTQVLALVSGLVKVVRTDRDGRKRLLAFRGPGEILGEMALQRGDVRLADVQTMSICKVTVIPADDFRRLVREHRLAEPLAELATRRLKEQTEVHDGDVRERLVMALLRLVEVSGGARSFSLTRDELAQHIGVGRKLVSKALVQLGPELVQAGKSRVGVVDVGGLRKALDGPAAA
ncbi:Crp/Fnr family transcriptional regulator [Streptomyces sp. C11-1]|uniref:Crp/Fnr family transcriptional regulator n=1 Tax=Streptomyces durocortorensis TaxID=2811104 RepID=A0ABY9W2B6_9ACTN|nr:Crp/Fnr family transcriptional regulator [Streptomyces durocortorensis]WNF30118.1 Crp/Fnr family transcriptional regulator [Streptomyces durocortorensis]